MQYKRKIFYYACETVLYVTRSRVLLSSVHSQRRLFEANIVSRTKENLMRAYTEKKKEDGKSEIVIVYFYASNNPERQRSEETSL